MPAAIRAVYQQRGEFAAAVELRRRFPGITERNDLPEGRLVAYRWTRKVTRTARRRRMRRRSRRSGRNEVPGCAFPVSANEGARHVGN